MRQPLFLIAVLAVLAFVACNSKFVGETCGSANEFCESDLSCREEFPGGGFCTKPCSPKGASASCPIDSLCIQEGTELLCAPVCLRDTDCRTQDGYECRGETGLSVRACHVKKPTDGGVP